MMSTDESLCLELDADPESIGVARRAVAELAERLGMTEPALGDVKTVVSEACTNVVRHAYPSGAGRYEVEAHRAAGDLTIIVRDFGVGVQGRVAAKETSLRLGLGIISKLVRKLEISGSGEGTEIRMRLPLPMTS
jgi:serine/threonine-protein kinase RsbW